MQQLQNRYKLANQLKKRQISPTNFEQFPYDPQSHELRFDLLDRKCKRKQKQIIKQLKTILTVSQKQFYVV